jgi:hypothetical protein
MLKLLRTLLNLEGQRGAVIIHLSNQVMELLQIGSVFFTLFGKSWEAVGMD